MQDEGTLPGRPIRRFPRPVPSARFLLALAFAAIGGRAATLVQHPYLQNEREDRVSILWSARENLPGLVQFSTDQSFSQFALARVREFQPSVTGLSYTFYQYRAELTGLAPGTDYSYRVMVGGQNLTPEVQYRFRTASPGPFSFLVFGDSGQGSPGQQAVAIRLAAEQPNLVLHVGDVAQIEGLFDEYASYYFEFYWTLMRQVPFFTVPGNHDYITAYANPYLSFQAPPVDSVPAPDEGRYYSFDRGDVHFIAIDSNLLSYEGASRRMLAWLENDLATTRATWRIPFFHHLPYPIDHHLGDPVCAAAQQQLVPLFERYGVQLVFSGHEHTYQRTKPMRGGIPVTSGPGTVYMVSGGGGGTLHDVVSTDFLANAQSVHHYLRVEADASRITMHAIGTDGKEFDTYSLIRPVLAAGTPVVDAAVAAPALAPGGLISIFGTGLAAETSQSPGPFPLSLSGTTVTVNGEPLPLLYVSSGQVNAQMPFDVRGAAVLRLTTSTGFIETAIKVLEAAPAIFPEGIRHATGASVTSALPARAGEAVVVYLTGLGQVTGGVMTGQAAPLSLTPVLATVEAKIGDRSVAPFFAGLTPGFVGVYQVNVIVPADLPPGVYPFRILAGGNLSNALVLQVQAPSP
jgi:uncharacterized protein (TIGR03437 family)